MATLRKVLHRHRTLRRNVASLFIRNVRHFIYPLSVGYPFSYRKELPGQTEEHIRPLRLCAGRQCHAAERSVSVVASGLPLVSLLACFEILD